MRANTRTWLRMKGCQLSSWHRCLYAVKANARLRFGLFAQIVTSRSVSATGRGRIRTVLTKLKMVVVAPITTASVTVATAVTLKLRASMRAPNRTSSSIVPPPLQRCTAARTPVAKLFHLSESPAADRIFDMSHFVPDSKPDRVSGVSSPIRTRCSVFRFPVRGVPEEELKSAPTNSPPAEWQSRGTCPPDMPHAACQMPRFQVYAIPEDNDDNIYQDSEWTGPLSLPGCAIMRGS
jgi:hypothetical protein